MRRFARFLILACAFAIILCACSQKKYRNDVSCRELSEAAIETIGDGAAYVEYSELHLKYEFDADALLADDFCIVYSVKVEDINEIGVFFSEDKDNVKAIAKACRAYLENMRETKRSFIASYAPLELPKLDKSKVMICGNYVIYTVLDSDMSDSVYDEIEKRLTK